MKIKCQFCNNEQEVEPSFIGEKINCIECQNVMEVINPNLQPCPDCFVLISKRAAMCPRCGAVLQTCDVLSIKVQDAPAKEETVIAEEHIATYRPSPINYVFSIIIGILLIPILIGIGILIFIAIDIFCTSYEITNKRLIVRKGWIAKRQSEIWIKDMRAVNFSQDIWQRLFGLGDIFIGTAATAGNEIEITGIFNPKKIVEEINSVRKS